MIGTHCRNAVVSCFYHMSECHSTFKDCLSQKMHSKQGIALTERNRTGPPCSAGRPTDHAPGPPAGNATDDADRRQQAKQ